MKKNNILNTDAAAAALLFLIVLGIYLETALPTIIFEDTGEFSVGSAVLGVSHPPGYPLYLLFAHIFSTFPFDEPAFGVVLFSSFAGAAGCALVFYATRMLGVSRAASWCAGALLGVTATLWSQSVIPEVYALALLISAALLCVLFSCFRGGSVKMFLAAVLLMGLSFLSHYISFASFSLVFLAAYLKIRIKGNRTVAMEAAALAIFLLIISAVVYLPLRAAAGPALAWGDATTLSGLYEHLRRSQFVFYENQLAFNLNTKIQYFKHFITVLPDEFTPVFLFMALLGAWLVIAERWKDFVLLIFLFLMHSIGVILFISFHYTQEYLSTFRVFYIGGYMVAAMFAAVGIDGVMKRAAYGPKGKPLYSGIAAACFAALVAWPLMQNLPANSWQHDGRALKFGRQIFRTMKRDAVFFVFGATHMPPVEYLHTVKNLRGDLIMFDMHGIFLRENIQKLGHKFSFMDMSEIENQVTINEVERRKIYVAFVLAMDTPGMPQFGARNLGPVFEITSGPVAADTCDLSIWKGGEGEFPPYGAADNYESSMLTALVMSRRSECDLETGNSVDGLNKLFRINDRFPANPFIETSIASVLLRYGYESKAMQWYSKAIEDCPTYTEAYTKLGDIYLRNAQVAKAKQFYQAAIEINPKLYTTMLSLANLHQYRGENAEAVSLYKKTLEIMPDAALAYNNLGNTYSNMGDWNNALRSYRKAIELSPYLSYSYNNLGAFYISRGQYGPAISTMKKFIRMEPRLAAGYQNLAFAYQKSGDYNNALENYQKAVESDPMQGGAWKMITTIQIDSGRPADAKATIGKMRSKAKELAALAESYKNGGTVSQQDIATAEKKSRILAQLADKIEKEVTTGGDL